MKRNEALQLVRNANSGVKPAVHKHLNPNRLTTKVDVHIYTNDETTYRHIRDFYEDLQDILEALGGVKDEHSS